MNQAAALIEDVKAYLRGGFADSNLSLKAAAARFGLNAAYFSAFFKERTGESFSDFQEEIRLVKADELLEDSGKKIEDIASMVGYNSAYSFRRAYKRVNGKSPRDAR